MIDNRQEICMHIGNKPLLLLLYYPPGQTPPGTAAAEHGTHPTGIHSCINCLTSFPEPHIWCTYPSDFLLSSFPQPEKVQTTIYLIVHKTSIER